MVAYGDFPIIELEDAVGQLAGLANAALAETFSIVAAIAESGEWEGDGSRTLADWLAGRLRISTKTARQWVRIGDALRDLPLVRQAFASGRLSYDQLRPLVRIATAATDEHWAREAPGMSPEQLDALAKARQRVERDHDAARHRQRSLRWYHREGMVHLAGRLAADDGEVVTTALARIAEAAKPVDGELWDPFDARCADGLVELASARLGDDADADRATIVIHAQLDDLAAGDDAAGAPQLASGLTISMETLERLGCDSRIQALIESADGRLIASTAVQRVVQPWLSRFVRQRDRHCRFPGCARTRLTQAHHLEHWAHGGATVAENLVLLCRSHHRLLHEGGWTISGSPPGVITWHRPGGRPLSGHPPTLRRDLAERARPPDDDHPGDERSPAA